MMVKALAVLLALSLLDVILSQRTCTTSRVVYRSSSSVSYFSEAYSDRYGCGFWNWRRCTRTLYRSKTRATYRQIASYYTTCCSGYAGSGCYAVCSPRCQHGGTCSSPNRCLCPSGWTGRTCSQDVDECRSRTHNCHQNAVCRDTDGSYTCSCNTGYTGNGFSCSDINECTNNNGGCHHNCHNTRGSYHCSCRNSYSLASDGKTCNVPPSAPTNVRTSSVGTRTVTVSWRAPTNNFVNSLTSVSSYRIIASQTLFPIDDIVVTTHRGATSYRFNNLQEYTTYTFTVVALNSFGSGPASGPVKAQTLQSAPSAAPLTVVASAESPYRITLRWSPPPLIDRNGVILYYESEIREVETGHTHTLTSYQLNASIDSLHPHYNYQCKVAAHTAPGTGPYSDVQLVQTHSAAPTAPPAELSVSAYDSTTITLTWQPPPPSKRNGDITQYRLKIIEQETQRRYEERTPNSGFTLTSLHPYYNYVISVAAETVGIGPYSSNFTQRTQESAPSSAPTNLLLVSVGSTSLSMTWDQIPAPNTNGVIRRYSIVITEVDTEKETPYSSLTRQHVITGLHPYYTYRCRVAAVTISSGPLSQPAEIQMPEDVPSGPPDGFLVEATSSRTLLLSWQPPVESKQNGIITQYMVELSKSAAEVLRNFSLNATQQTLLINGTYIEPFTVYGCRIAAFTQVGKGPYSNKISLQTPEDTPTSPHISTLSRVIGHPNQLFIQWEPPHKPNGQVLVFHVYCRISVCECSGHHQSTGNVTLNVRESPTSCSCESAEDSMPYQQQAIISGHLTRTNVSGLLPYTRYTCFMTASTSVGEGEPSDALSAITDESVPGNPPQEFHAAAVNSTAFQLTWNEPLTPNGIIVAYHIVHNISASANDSIVVNAEEKNYTVGGLNEYTVYFFVIYASTRIGNGPSTHAVGRTDESTPHSPPRNIRVFNVGKRSATISWIPPVAEHQNGPLTYYKIQITQTQLSGLPNITQHSSDLSYTFQDLEEYVLYKAVVAAATSTGVGPFSPEVSFTTKEDVPSASPIAQNGTAQSSSVVIFSWCDPPPLDLNGNLRYFKAIVTEIPTGRNWSLIAVESHITLASLHPYYNYSCEVAAFTIGLGPYSQPFYALTGEEAPDAPPSRPQVVSFTSDSILLTWQPPPAEHMNGRLQHYRVSYKEEETSDYQAVLSDMTNVTLSGLHPYFTYTFKVRAETIAPGPYSAEQSVQLDEDAPSGTVTLLSGLPINPNAVLLTWLPPPYLQQNGIIRHYNVYVTESETGHLRNYTTSTTNLTVASLHPYYTYQFAVQAVTIAEGPLSDPVVVMTPEAAPSDVVQDIKVTEYSSRKIVLSWRPPDPEYQNGVIIIYYVLIDFPEVMELNFTNTSAEIENLKPHTAYGVQIAAATIAGVGPYSAALSFQTLEDAPSSAPVNVVLNATDSHTLSVSWHPPVAQQRNGVIRGYTLTLIEVDTGVTTVITSNSTQVVLQDLHPFFTYNCTVAATTILVGPSSNTVTITMPEDIPSGSPANFSAVSITSLSVVLEWNPPEFNERNGVIIGYLLNYTTTDTNMVVSHSSNDTAMVVQPLQPHTLYIFHVAAETSVGVGPFSLSLQITTAEDAPSSSPVNVSVEIIDSTTVKVKWQSPPPSDHNGVVRYYVVNLTELDSALQFKQTVDTSPMVVSSLHPYYTYEVIVAAATVAVGPYTLPVSFRLPEDAPSGPPIHTHVEATSSTSVNITWSPPPPENQNGIITSYTVNITDLDSGEYVIIVTPNNTVFVSSLQPHTAYGIVLYASTTGGHGPATIPLTVRTHEDAPTHGPTNLTVVDIGPTYIHLTWSHPPDDTHQGIIREYHVYTTELETGRTLFNSTTADDAEVFLSFLHPFYVYHTKVAAVTVQEGNFTTLSVRTEEAAPSGPPQNVQTTVNNSRTLIISWQPPVAEYTNGILRHYIINIRGPDGREEQISTVTHQLSYSARDLSPFTNYSISVAGVTVATGPFSPSVDVEMPEDAPSSSPQNLSATILSSRKLHIVWMPPPRQSRNGIIRSYVIKITQIDSSDTWQTTSASTDIVLSLHSFYRYSFAVAAVTVYEGPYSEHINIEMPEDAPSAPPQNVSVTNVSSISITLTWDPPAPEHHNGIIRYYIVNTTSQLSEPPYWSSTRSSDTTLDIVGLRPFTTYCLRIAAFTVGVGPTSSPVNTTTMPSLPTGEPTNVTAGPLNSTAIHISWSPPAPAKQNGILTNYIVNITTLDSGSSVTFIVFSLEFEVGQLQPFSVYAITVASQNSVGVGPYTHTALVQTLEDAPGPPQDVQVSNLTSTHLTLQWNAPLPDEHNGIIRLYEIQLVDNQTGHTEYFRTQYNTHWIGMLHPYYSYTIAVRATTVKWGLFTESVEIRTLQDIPSGPPQNITAVVQSSIQVVIEWKPPRGEDRNGVIGHYIVNIFETETEHHYQEISILPSLTLSNLHPFYTYQISVAAVTIGAGPYSAVTTFQMLEAAPSGPPLNFTGEAVSSTSILLSWEAPSNSEQNGLVRYYNISITDSSTGIQSIYQVSSDHTQAVIVSLHPYHSYECRVAATTISVGVQTMPITIKTLQDAPSRPPLGLSAMAVNSTAINASWSPMEVEDINGILQYYSLNVFEVVTGRRLSFERNLTQMTLTSLHPYYVYKLSVAAATVVGIGPFSNFITVITHQDVPTGSPVDVKLQSVASTSAVMSWKEPSLDQHNGVLLGYVVALTNTKDTVKLVVNATTAFISDVVLSPLEPFTTYNVSVAATTVNGTGPFSFPLEFTTAQSAPGGAPLEVVASSVTTNSIHLSWSPPPVDTQNGRITLYMLIVIVLETKEKASLKASTTKTVVENLHPFYTYNISVAAFTTDIGPYSSHITVKTLEDVPTGPPQDLVITSITSTTISMKWDPPLFKEQNGLIREYHIAVCVTESETCYGVVSSNTSFTLTALHPYYTYNISVAAVTIDVGPLSESQLVTCLEEAPSGTPQHTSVVALSSTSLNISWMPPASHELNGVIRHYIVNVIELQSGDSYNFSVNETGLFVSSLHPYFDYKCAVAAVTVGIGPFSNATSVQTFQDVPSGPPQDMNITVLNTRSMNVSWAPPSHAHQNGNIQYYLLRVVEVESRREEAVNVSSTLHFIFSDLHPHYTYRISVAAATIATGPYSHPQEVKMPQDVPSGSPRNIQGTSLHADNIELRWDPPKSDELNGIIVAYYINVTHVESGESHSFRVGRTQFFSGGGFHPHYTYICTVFAVTVGLGPGNSINVTTREAAPSSPPLNVTAIAVSPTAAELLWLPPPSEHQNGIIREYSVLKVTLPSGLLEEHTVTDVSISFDDLNPYTPYIFVVAAKTIALGPFSDQVKLEMPEKKPAHKIDNLTVSVETASSVLVSWLPPPITSWNGVIVNYTIFIEHVGPIIESDINDSTTHYFSFTRIVPNSEESLSNNPDPHFATLPLKHESTLIDSLQESHVYQFDIVTANSAGVSDKSVPVIQELPGAEPSGAPNNIQIQVLSSTSIEILWDPPDPLDQNGVITGYLISVTDELLNVVNVFNATMDRHSYMVDGLAKFTDYVVVIAAVNIDGKGPNSNPIPIKTLEDVPSVPVNITLKQVGDAEVVLSWEPPLQPNGILDVYEIWYAASAIGPMKEDLGVQYGSHRVTSNLQVIFSNLSFGLLYSFKVRASTGAGHGNYSRVISLEMSPMTQTNESNSTTSYGGLGTVSKAGSEIVVVTLLAIGGWFVAIVCVIIVIWLCYKRKKTEKNLKSANRQEPKGGQSSQEMDTGVQDTSFTNTGHDDQSTVQQDDHHNVVDDQLKCEKTTSDM